jgi:hypothetical protein
MQEPRTEAQAGRDAPGVADRPPDGLQPLRMGGVTLDIGEERAIVAGAEPPKMRLEMARERVAGTGGRQRRSVPGIREELDAASGENCRSGGSFPVLS